MKCKNIKYIKCYVILLLFILSLFICSFVVSSYNTSATSISISVSPSTVNIYKGKTKTLKAKVKGTSDKVSWSSSNTKIVTVDSKGKIKAKKSGSANIRAKVKGKTAICKVKVYDYVSKITLSKTSISCLYPKQSTKITAKVSPSTAYQKSVNWSTSNSKVATVKSNGEITAKSVGSCYIIATAKDEKKKRAKCKVYIRQPAKSISVTTIQDVYTGQTHNLKAKVNPINAYNKNILYSSSDTSIVTVDTKGNVTAISSEGTAIITCTAADRQGAKATVTVTIRQSVTSLQFEKTNYIIGTKGTKKVNTIIGPENAYNKVLKFKSSNTKIAKVDKDGNVTGVSVGETIISATTTDGSNITASCIVKIELSATKLSISGNFKIPINYKSKVLSLSVTPSNASTSQIQWFSSNSKIVSVDNKGKVTLHKYGTAYVYCYNDNGTNLYSNKCKITVYKKYITKIKLSKSKLSINEHKKYKLKAQIYPNDATDKRIYWTSTNKKVAVVNQKGIVTAKSKGKCKIYVKAKDGSKKKVYAQITVKRLIKKITCPSKMKINAGKNARIKVNVYPSSASYKSLKYKVSNKNVRYYKGKIYGKHKGSATITFYTKDGSKKSCKCRVYVSQLVKKVNISYSTMIFNKRNSVKFPVSVYPSNANNKKLKWYSSNNRIATVNSSGRVTPKSKGYCYIYAKAKDGSGKYDKCKVTVKQPVTKITMDYSSISMYQHSTVKLSAKVYPSNADEKSILWYSSNNKVAQVYKGTVKAMGKGTCYITAQAGINSKTKKCKITVYKGTGERVSISNKSSSYNGKIIKLSSSSKKVIVNFISNSIIGNSNDFKLYATTAQTIHDYLDCYNINAQNSTAVKNAIKKIAPTFVNINSSSSNKSKITNAVNFIFEHGGISVKHRLRYMYDGSDKLPQSMYSKNNIVVLSKVYTDGMIRFFD